MSDVQVMTGAAGNFFNQYDPADSAYDEIFRRRGEVRETWRELFSTIGNISRTELTRRWLQAQEEIHATGIAYNVYDDSPGVSRPWELDLLPQLIGTEEWAALAAGLEQRARLLNRVLADLYGPQELLAGGLLPAEWLFSHPGFRRVFHGQQPPGGTYLHFYAADLARAADGRWWVMGDRTDAPLGLGYALENRILTSRMLPHAIGDMHVERLAPFFITLQKTLRDLAPAHGANPRIVLLSQGPGGPNYFEDAYLARYLGYTLVEGGDLAVRDDQVFLKTLAGLLPVDVVLRRLSDEFSDPLELRGDAQLGVAGLLQAARLGNVTVANALGSSLAESPSLMPFLPGVARAWLGEELALPSVATWWCGQQQARAQVAAMAKQEPAERLWYRPAFRVGRKEAADSQELHARTAKVALQLLQTCPAELIAQEAIPGSTSPVWCDGTSSRWRLALRVYVVAKGNSYEVMPGGLVRLAQDPRSLGVSILSGQVSKDVWVRSTAPVHPVSLLTAAKQPLVLRRTGAELPSRVADNLFWFGRNLERAQGACRLLRPIVVRLTGELEAEATPELGCLIRCLAAQGQIEPGFAVEGLKEKLPAFADVLPATVLGEEQPGSLRSAVAGAHRNASLVRDRLSLDIWRIVHQLERELSHASIQLRGSGQPPHDAPTSHDGAERYWPASPFGLVELDDLLDQLLVSMAALDGLIGESMTRTPAWRFLDLGRRIERALHLVAIVQSLPGVLGAEEGRVLEAILEVVDSLMTYRARYLAAFHRAAAIDLLVTDETNPRSLIYQLAAVANHVDNLPRGELQPLGTAEERIASSLLHGVRMIDVEDLSGTGGERTKLGRLLQRIADQLPKLSDLVSHRYLIHAGRPQQLSEERSGAR